MRWRGSEETASLSSLPGGLVTPLLFHEEYARTRAQATQNDNDHCPCVVIGRANVWLVVRAQSTLFTFSFTCLVTLGMNMTATIAGVRTTLDAPDRKFIVFAGLLPVAVLSAFVAGTLRVGIDVILASIVLAVREYFCFGTGFALSGLAVAEHCLVGAVCDGVACVRGHIIVCRRGRWRAVCAVCGICSSGTVLCCTPHNTHR